jgi:diguanylate cyclase (GGDEF)-like protein/PAS domain S-box-containing protein
VKLTLKLKVTLIATATILALLAVVGFVQDARLGRDFRIVLETQQDALAESVADHLGDKLETYLTVLEHSASLVDDRLLSDAAARQDFLSRLSAARPLFDGLALADPGGEVLSNEPPLAPQQRIQLADREYFQRVLREGRTVVSRPLMARTGAGPAVLLAAPVRDAQGRTQAVLLGGLHLQRANLLGLLAHSPVGRTGHFEIVTLGPEPVYVVHPDPARLMTPAAPVPPDARDVITRKSIARADWELRVVLPAWEAAAPVREGQRTLVRDLALMGLAAAVLVWGVMRWLLHPLTTLHRAIHVLRRNTDAQVKLDTRSRDERGDLARDFEALLAELRTRKQELASIFEATTDFVIQTDARGRITYLNPEARRVLGLAADQPVHTHDFSDFNTPETNVQFRQEILPTVLDRGHWVGETSFLAAEGREVRVSHLVIAHRDRDGRIAHFSGVMRDITEQVAARQEAQRQATTLRSIAENLPAIVAVVGADERYRYVNQAFERWFGRHSQDIVGRTVREVLGEAEYGRSLVWLQRVLAGETVKFEKDYPGRNDIRHLSISYIPLQLGDGVIDGFVGVAQDITAHRLEAGRLKGLAETDALTGLLNRAGFEADLARRASAGDGPGLALLYIDLDHFKPVNDRHGHPVGDQLLRQFAARLRTLVRPTDAVARLGGDEFAIVLSGIREQSHAEAVAAKVVEAAGTAFIVDGLELHIGACVGLALGVHTGESVEDLVARADAQLYRAKACGRSRWVAASSV